MTGRALIDHGRFLDVLGIEVELLLRAAGTASPGTAVPVSPRVTVGEVVRHVGGAYRVAMLWIANGRAPVEWQREPAPGQSTEDYLRTGLAELTGELSRSDPDSYAASWWPADHTYGFWYRRMAHETTIHRYDVEHAVGEPISEVAEDYAIDGVDEALAVWFGQRLAMLGLSGTGRRSVAVRAGGHHWIARAGPGLTEAWRCSVEEAERADGMVSASPGDMYLWMWGRLSHQEVDWSGSEDAIAQLWALMRLATR